MRVEVRTPTYKRPGLLRRALESLVAQTHKDWLCLVLDDSPENEAAAICTSLNDARILYKPNPINLGICRNLDQSFSLAPRPQSDFLCVLEDDNYYLAENFKNNTDAAERYGVDIVLRNQLIERMVEPDQPGELASRTMFEGQYTEGRMTHEALFASFFYSTGANNSSLFWRAGAGLDFSTLPFADDPVSQERLRTLCIDRDVLVELEPLIVWRDNGAESLRPSLNGFLRWRLAQVRAAAEEREIYRALDTYLRAAGSLSRRFEPPAGPFTPELERVFHRVGIHVPPSVRRLTAKERWTLHVKRMLAKVAIRILGLHYSLFIDPALCRLSVSRRSRKDRWPALRRSAVAASPRRLAQEDRETAKSARCS